MQALSEGQLNALPTQAAALTSAQLNALTADQLTGSARRSSAALSTTELAGLSTTHIGELTARQLQSLTASQIAGLTSAQVGALGTDQVSSLKVTQIRAIETGDLQALQADRIAAFSPDRSDQREWTYREVLAQSESVARYLMQKFEPGERVAVLAPNVPEWWLLEFGAALAGVVVVAVNPASKPPELRHVLIDSESCGIMSMSGYRGPIPGAWSPRWSPSCPCVRETVFLEDVIGLVADYCEDDRILPVVGPDDLFMIQYTSGTTGPPKGAMMRHRGVVNTSKFATERFALDEASVWLNCMPMCHTGGSVHSTLGTLWNIGTMLMVPQFDAGFALDARSRPKVRTGSPPCRRWR